MVNGRLLAKLGVDDAKFQSGLGRVCHCRTRRGLAGYPPNARGPLHVSTYRNRGGHTLSAATNGPEPNAALLEPSSAFRGRSLPTAVVP
jgi:hypothetical protein